jgi:glutathione S-transferase
MPRADDTSAESTAWIEAEDARVLPGLRVALTAGVPGPWGEATKGVFHAKGIPFARVRQLAGAPNDALFEWTGHRSAPVVVYEDERPRIGWSEILLLAERLAPEPALIPSDPAERALMFGLAHELMAEEGFGWSRRLSIFRATLGDVDEPSEPVRVAMGRMLRDYGWSRAAGMAADARVIEILGMFSARLAQQRAAGHRYLMGARLSALDIYWAAMCGIVSPLPAEVCPMQEGIRGAYSTLPAEIARALDPALLELRDHVYQTFLEYPLVL